MYPLGHLGVALVLSAPAPYALHPKTATGFTVFALLTALLPDIDRSLPYLTHHGLTHTVAFAVLVGLFVGALAAGVVAGLRRWTDVALVRRFSPERVATYVGIGLSLGTLSHVLGDILVTFPTAQPVSPFWPLSSQTFKIGVFGLDSPMQNAVLFGVGLLAQWLAAWRSVESERENAPQPPDSAA